MKGNTILSVSMSPASALFARNVIVRKKKNLEKNKYISDFLLNAPFNSAKNFPDVSPILKDKLSKMIAQVGLRVLLSNFVEKAGPGKRVKVTIKVQRIIKGQGTILKKVYFKVVK